MCIVLAAKNRAQTHLLHSSICVVLFCGRECLREVHPTEFRPPKGRRASEGGQAGRGGPGAGLPQLPLKHSPGTTAPGCAGKVGRP